MRRRDFEAMVRQMADELPPDFRDGIVAVEVTAKTVPHPVRAGIYTMGECVPHAFGTPGDEAAQLRSTVYLHYGSFAALASGDRGFDQALRRTAMGWHFRPARDAANRAVAVTYDVSFDF